MAGSTRKSLKTPCPKALRLHMPQLWSVKPTTHTHMYIYIHISLYIYIETCTYIEDLCLIRVGGLGHEFFSVCFWRATKRLLVRIK